MRDAIRLKDMVGLVVEGAEYNKYDESVCILFSGGKYVVLSSSVCDDEATIYESNHKPEFGCYPDELIGKFYGYDVLAEWRREHKQRVLDGVRRMEENERRLYEELKAKFEGKGNA